MPPSDRKDEIRRLVLARRSRLDAGERDRRGARIAQRALALPELAGVQAVVAYVGVRSEVPTAALMTELLARGVELRLPFVGEDGSMRAAPVRSLDELAPGYRGIPEPRARFPVDAAGADAIIVPGVAFDEAGGRLGYGGGFYDAFLRATAETPRIGLAFEVQIVGEVPTTEDDERVDVVVTEERTIRIQSRRDADV